MHRSNPFLSNMYFINNVHTPKHFLKFYCSFMMMLNQHHVYSYAFSCTFILCSITCQLTHLIYVQRTLDHVIWYSQLPNEKLPHHVTEGSFIWKGFVRKQPRLLNNSSRFSSNIKHRSWGNIQRSWLFSDLTCSSLEILELLSLHTASRRFTFKYAFHFIYIVCLLYFLFHSFHIHCIILFPFTA